MSGILCPHCHAQLEVYLTLQVAVPGEVLEESTENLLLSMRSWNILCLAGIKTVRQLVAQSEHDLGKIRGCGRAVLAEIKGVLAAKGLQLRKEDEEAKP